MEQSFAQYAHTLTQLQQLAQQADPNQFLKQILNSIETTYSSKEVSNFKANETEQ